MNALAPSAIPKEMAFYRAAHIALINAKTVDEVLEIKSRAEAIRAYALEAKNFELELNAIEIRLRATRMIGVLLNAAIEDGHLERAPSPNRQGQGRTPKPLSKSHLLLTAAKECGVNQNLAILAQRMARPSDGQFQDLIDQWRKRCLSEGKTSRRLLPLDNPTPKATEYVDPPRPPGPLDNFFSHEGYPIGDLSVERLPADIRFLQRHLKIVNALFDHIGDVSHLIEAARTETRELLVRDVINNSRLEGLLRGLGVDEKEWAAS
jgi:hypothetical protein